MNTPYPYPYGVLVGFLFFSYFACGYPLNDDDDDDDDCG